MNSLSGYILLPCGLSFPFHFLILGTGKKIPRARDVCSTLCPGCWKRFIMLLQQRPLPRMDSSSWLVCPVAWFRITATGRHISHELVTSPIILAELWPCPWWIAWTITWSQLWTHRSSLLPFSCGEFFSQGFLLLCHVVLSWPMHWPGNGNRHTISAPHTVLCL